MLENLSLNELEQERTRIDNEIKRVALTRAERFTREHKLSELAAIKREVDAGIKEIRSLTLKEAQQARGTTSPAA